MNAKGELTKTDKANADIIQDHYKSVFNMNGVRIDQSGLDEINHNA